MKKIRSLIWLFAFLASGVVHALEMTEDFVKACSQPQFVDVLQINPVYTSCRSYMEAALDMVTIYSVAYPGIKAICIPAKTGDLELFLAMVLNYIKGHSDVQNGPAALAIFAALQTNYRCPR